MWTLSRLLPLMIGDKVPSNETRWINFLLLLDIMDIVFSPIICEDQISFLHLLIEEHHQQFKILYPHCSITPKLHFMIHYPAWISKYVIVN